MTRADEMELAIIALIDAAFDRLPRRARSRVLRWAIEKSKALPDEARL